LQLLAQSLSLVATRLSTLNGHIARPDATSLATSLQQRIEFKLAVLVYNPLADLSPQYLADDCQPAVSISRLRLCPSNVRGSTTSRQSAPSIIHRCWTAFLWNNLYLSAYVIPKTLSEYRFVKDASVLLRTSAPIVTLVVFLK